MVHCIGIDTESKCRKTFTLDTGGKKTSINSLKVSRDGNRLFVGTASPTRRVHCFDFESCAELCVFPQHKDSVFAITNTDELLISGGGQNDKTMLVSDLETQALLWSFQHKGSVRGLDASHNSILSGSLDGYVRLFDVRSESVVKQIKLPSTVHGVSFCAFDDRKAFCSTGRTDNGVYWTDFESSRQLSQHKNGVSSFYANAYSVCSADYDGYVYRNIYGAEKPAISKTDDGEIHALAALGPNAVFHAVDGGILIHSWNS